MFFSFLYDEHQWLCGVADLKNTPNFKFLQPFFELGVPNKYARSP
jgi:hypothetical protein